MTQPPGGKEREGQEGQGRASPAEERRAQEKARLAEALRDNLRRRKEQARRRQAKSETH